MTYGLEESFLTHLQVALLSILCYKYSGGVSWQFPVGWELRALGNSQVGQTVLSHCPSQEGRRVTGGSPRCPTEHLSGVGEGLGRALTGRWVWSRDGQGCGDLDTSPVTDWRPQWAVMGSTAPLRAPSEPEQEQ